jgi:hypothetical protein
MTLQKVIIALSCVACFAVGSYSQAIINHPTTKTNLDLVRAVSNYPIGQDGYFQIKATLYRRIVSGVLWGTTVTYRSKTAYYYAHVANYDGTFNYSTDKYMQRTRPDGKVDFLRHTIQPYINVDIHYFYTPNSGVGNRDLYQIMMHPELTSKVYTSYGNCTTTIYEYPQNAYNGDYFSIWDGYGSALNYSWKLP